MAQKLRPRLIGCRIALDDVGTGRNGLSYMLKLGADIIKIDNASVAVKADPSQAAAVLRRQVKEPAEAVFIKVAHHHHACEDVGIAPEK